jgi:diguanylate cyclase (GGDEF)-like protein
MTESTIFERGNGFLSLRLEHALDLELRRRIGMRDWALAVLVVGTAQISGVIPIGWPAFFALLGVAIVAIGTWAWVFPRFTHDAALWTETAMNALTAFTLLGLIAASGGASSPYIFFYAFLIVYVAAFVERSEARIALIALASLCALAPIYYDWDAAGHENFIPTIVIAVCAWVAAGALIALKRSSAVKAELQARRLAYVDSLTGAATRRALDEYAALLSAAGQPFAIAYVHALGVEFVNRAAGHLAGDELLRRTTRAMRIASGPTDQVVRLGGTEFAVLLPQADAEAAKAWTRRLHERLMLENALVDSANVVTASAGSAAGGELAEMLVRAERSASSWEPDQEALAAARPSSSERAEHLRQQLERTEDGERRPVIESVDAPTAPWLAVIVAACFGVGVALTGGASSMLLSLAVLIVAYFAVFGSRFEAIVATGSTIVAMLVALLSQSPVSRTDQARTLTVLVAILILADTIQRNARAMSLAERRAAELSQVDIQTQLGNRSAFERELTQMIPQSSEMARSRAEKFDGVPAVIAVGFVDLARLRTQLGEQGDDILLLEIAEALRNVVGDGPAFRVGIDDFAVLLRAHHRQHVDEVIAVCEETIRESVRQGSGSDVERALELRFGGALWQQGMTGAELAAAAVADQMNSQPGSLHATVRL